MKKILVADLLCGAGGSSTGCARALAKLGLEMELVCVNHWPTAIETHTKNHPEARHYCQDIATVRPHQVVPEGYLDLLMASPTCTHHSVARGGKPTSDQQRSDPWHIITWLTELRVQQMIIENVWEFIGWGPVDHATGKPIKERKGEYFSAWIDTIRRFGYEPEWRKLNAANYGGATTRQRFILKARLEQKRVAWAPLTHAKRADDVLLFPGMKPWRPAREIIDWSIQGKSIFNRKRPLAPKTLARIHAGAVKFKWPEPFLVILRNHMGARTLDEPIPTVAARGTHTALAEPVIVNMKGQSTARDIDEPLPTITSHAGHVYVAEPFVMAPGSSGAPRSDLEPLPTITTGGAGSPDPGCARPMLIEPFVLSRHAGGAPRSIQDPTPTQVAKQSHVLISPYYGDGSGKTCKSTDEPLDTVTSKGRFGMVVPVTHTQGSNAARDLADPLPTLTTAKGGEFAMVLPVTHQDDSSRARPVDDPLMTVTGANRGEIGIAEATPEYDILFRMLEPHELAAAMGFDGEDQRYEFAGNKTEKIKQIGNAVSVEMMEAEVAASFADYVETTSIPAVKIA